MGRILWFTACLGLLLASSQAHAAPSSSDFWVSVSGEYRRGTFQREWAAFLALNVAFERLASSRVRPADLRIAEEPAKNQSAAAPEATPPAPEKAPLSVALSPKLARGAVRRALKVAGYLETRARLASLAARSKSSAALPELGLRTLRSSGQLLRLTPTSEDPYRYTQAGTSELSFEARVTWHLDRLVFADQEVSIERLQSERDSAERRLVDHVLLRLAAWQRGRARAADLANDSDVRQNAELEAIGAAVELDVLTDGWFSQAIGESEGQGASGAGEPAKVELKTPSHAR